MALAIGHRVVKWLFFTLLASLVPAAITAAFLSANGSAEFGNALFRLPSVLFVVVMACASTLRDTMDLALSGDGWIQLALTGIYGASVYGLAMIMAFYGALTRELVLGGMTFAEITLGDDVFWIGFGLVLVSLIAQIGVEVLHQAPSN